MRAELGQTTDPKALIPGEPQLLSGDLKELVRTIDKMAGISEGLGGIVPKEWSGDAADRFREVFGQQPKNWIDTIGVLGKGATALADYGDALTWSQGEAQRAIELFTQAQAASRAAAADHQVRMLQASSIGAAIAPLVDPGRSAMAEAQQILENARGKLEQVGGMTAEALGFTRNDDGTYSKDVGKGKEFGADHRTLVDQWNDEKGKSEKKDPGGWQKGRFGRSFNAEFGDQSDGMFGDKIGSLLESLGIDSHESTASASAGVDLLDGSLDGKFGSEQFGGSGKIEGAVLGANAEAHAGASILGVNAGASAEAYLAKGSAEGELHLSDHAGLKGSAEGEIGASASAEGSIGVTGAQGSAEAFVGARAEGDVSAEVGGVSAGVHGEAWAGAGVEASGQVGMGDDGKFHLGASVGVGVGIGGKIGFDIAIDPGEVVDTVKDVADDVGEVVSDVGKGVSNAAGAVADFLGF